MTPGYLSVQVKTFNLKIFLYNKILCQKLFGFGQLVTISPIQDKRHRMVLVLPPAWLKTIFMVVVVGVLELVRISNIDNLMV